MARVLDHYIGEAQGGATFYVYSRPNDTSSAVRVYSGSVIILPPDYYSREENHMWPTISPSGWMFFYNIGSIEPVYCTVPDPCTPPDSVTLSNGVLHIKGGDGGEQNYFEYWEVSYRERGVNDTMWIGWRREFITFHEENPVSADTGKVRQYRVRTCGSAGSDYYSDYVVCETLLNGNTAAGMPTVELPIAGGSSRMHSPSVRINCPPDPDDDPMRLIRRIDGGEMELAMTLDGAGGVIHDQLPPMAEGEHVVEYMLRDVNNLDSEIDRTSFTVEPSVWTRAIAPGDIISNREISHRADIEELLSAVNGIRAFYGLGEVDFPGTIGRFADWQAQMQALLSGVGDVYDMVEKTHPAWPEATAYPSAAVINAIREACEA